MAALSSVFSYGKTGYVPRGPLEFFKSGDLKLKFENPMLCYCLKSSF